MVDVPAGQLFIGGGIDAATHERDGKDVLLPSADFTTHGVIVGMTGSGKTGLGIALIEEVLLSGLPALVIDPKGDLTNLLLTFPALQPEDFKPWVESGDPAEVAKTWTDGLASWGEDGARIQKLQDAADFTIYTPGSTSGVPLNVVGSLRAPKHGMDAELVRDEVEGFVAGLLGLVGIQADPLASKEFILLANILEDTWAKGQDLDLPTLVSWVQDPPLRKLGVFDLETFYPKAERTKLAMKLNGLLASSSFAAWAQGPVLDIDTLLWGPDKKPACAIIELSHLSDDERQFAVSLVLGKLVTWMRQQPGTSNLRALVYFDEVVGFVPPTAVPPAKGPILTILKQARAFGVGMVLATQNPVDIDYKAISNAGTWMIGRLQTEQDKSRLLDGMKSAAGGVDIGQVDATISGLGKHQFVLRRAGKDDASVITSRWDLCYLRGPLTRDQIASLMAEQKHLETLPPPPSAGAQAADVATPGITPVAATTAAAPAAVAADEVAMQPDVAAGIAVRWVDPAAPWLASVGAVGGSARLAPAIVARAQLLFDDAKADIRDQEEWECVLFPLSAAPDPATAIAVDYDDRDLVGTAPPAARYVLTDAPIKNKAYFATAQKALVDHLFRNRTHEVLTNKKLKVYSRPGETSQEFGLRCLAIGNTQAEGEVAKLSTTYAARISAAQSAVEVANASKQQGMASAGASVLGGLLGGILGGRRSSRSVATELGRAARGAGSVRTAGKRADAKEQRLSDLHAEVASKIADVHAKWDANASAIESVTVSLEKTDINIAQLSLVWLPVK